MTKVTDRVPKVRLDTRRLNHVFLKIYPYAPNSKFQESEIGSDLTLTQSKIKILLADSELFLILNIPSLRKICLTYMYVLTL